jgi:hypothetical protein
VKVNLLLSFAAPGSRTLPIETLSSKGQPQGPSHSAKNTVIHDCELSNGLKTSEVPDAAS